MRNNLDQLRQEMSGIEPVPANCASFVGRPRMEGTAFFPGGDGVFKPTPTPGVVQFPIQGVLVLGSDFGDEASYDQQFNGVESWHDEGSGPTWRNLLKLTDASGIRRSDLFCTNAWPCLRKGGKAVGGAPPASRNAGFTRRCQTFFLATLQLLQPRLVVPLGIYPTAFIASIGDTLCPWGRVRGWRDVDHTPIWKRGNRWVVPIVHPSMPNRRHRSEANTFEAEANLLAQARRLAS